MLKAALWPRPPNLLHASPAQGAPQSILLRGCCSLSLREMSEAASGCELQPKCLLPLPSPLLPPSSPAFLCSRRQQHWRSEQRRALAQDPPFPPPLPPPILVIHLLASQARQGAVLAPWGQGCAEKEGEATAQGQPAFSVVWREGLGQASCFRIYN